MARFLDEAGFMPMSAVPQKHSMLALDLCIAHSLKVAAAGSSLESNNDSDNDDAHDADACSDYESMTS